MDGGVYGAYTSSPLFPCRHYSPQVPGNSLYPPTGRQSYLSVGCVTFVYHSPRDSRRTHLVPPGHLTQAIHSGVQTLPCFHQSILLAAVSLRPPLPHLLPHSQLAESPGIHKPKAHYAQPLKYHLRRYLLRNSRYERWRGRQQCSVTRHEMRKHARPSYARQSRARRGYLHRRSRRYSANAGWRSGGVTRGKTSQHIPETC